MELRTLQSPMHSAPLDSQASPGAEQPSADAAHASAIARLKAIACEYLTELTLGSRLCPTPLYSALVASNSSY